MQEEGWNIAPVAIPLVALLIGWVLGFFDSRNKVKKVEDSAKAAIGRAEGEIAELKAKAANTPTTPYSVDDPGLMRVKNENGVLTLELDGERMIPNALTTEQRKRLIEMLNAMRPWLEGKPAMAPATTIPPSMKPATPASIQEKPAHPSVEVSPAQHATQTPTPTNKPAQKKKADEHEAPPTSIVGQINLILQEQIANTPLASRGLSMMESPSGGVNVYVGMNRYEGVDDVPDEEIKVAIRKAIAAWENKYTPGISQ